ncbi:hypothetical protein [Actinokineospora sp. NBRC 105648]|uniref:hypothetical protein n=1 Tax=Actinokineospora sp. NBRC 105648 TaxID=3032206 RepID=UPI002552DC6A|nr:hypothetical protein [Actinokineospora sp. NBRC 105648]
MQAYARTGQPVNAWTVRVTGPGLTDILPGNAGKAFLAFDDDDATETREVFVDPSHPLNVFAVVNGTVFITVSVTDVNVRRTYCAKTIRFAHP